MMYFVGWQFTQGGRPGVSRTIISFTRSFYPFAETSVVDVFSSLLANINNAIKLKGGRKAKKK